MHRRNSSGKTGTRAVAAEGGRAKATVALQLAAPCRPQVSSTRAHRSSSSSRAPTGCRQLVLEPTRCR